MIAAILTEIAIIVLLLIANGVFAASELGLVSARRSRLEQQAESGDRRAAQALTLAEQPDRLLATVQVGITVIGTFAAAFGGARISDVFTVLLASVPPFAPYAETLALVLVVAMISYLSLIIGELVPKRLALAHPDAVARTFAPLLTALLVIARPVVWVLTRSTYAVLWLLRQHRATQTTVTEDDIIFMAREGRAGGTVADTEEEMIARVFDLSDRTAHMIMTPRPDVVAANADLPLLDIARLAIDHGFSRLPVFRGNSLDHVVGTVHIKDLLPSLIENKPQQLTEVLRTPMYVLEHEPVAALLQRFRSHGTHMGLVVDEYGQIAGLITLEDVLEELVGDIRDEYDQTQEQGIMQRADGTWLIEGAEPFETVANRLSLAADEHEGFVTMAGFVLERLGRVPVEGDAITWGRYVVEVIDMDGRRIDKLLLRSEATSEL